MYLTLKWLVVTHKLINITSYFKIVEDIYTALQEMMPPVIHNNFENYLYKTLVKFYIQYLQKYCIIKLKEYTVERYP